VLFNSLGFLTLYLPLVVGVFFWVGRFNRTVAEAWLAAASLFFYAYWDSRYLLLLGASIGFNFVMGRALVAWDGRRRRAGLVFALAVNLGLLVVYKYADFFIGSVNGLTSSQFALLNLALPIGISFFTFTQISFLVDAYQGKVKEPQFLRYVLFVTYFPHLIAGPVLHHKEMMPQFADPKNYAASSLNIAVGLSIFTVGLAKKVLLADNLAPIANGVFAAGAQPSLIEAWVGVLAYTFQLYFDFSGYCDMAIGLSRLFGIRLPLNFNSPYKAVNISEFWRRWHMTLSRFLRDYLYVPLGGNRAGLLARYRNLMLTMLLGGLWHGAGWTFVVWGGLHGLYLVVHHGWQALVSTSATPSAAATPAGVWRGRLSTWGARWLTFAAVAFAWIFFRAADFSVASGVIAGLLGQHGVSLPGAARPFAGLLASVGLAPGFGGIRWLDAWGLCTLLGAMALAWWAPNTQELFRHFEPCLEKMPPLLVRARLRWQPSLHWSLGLAGLLCVCLLSLNRPSDFLYFQF
jgi:D-alanyl-lipoteichoic acid acyltransferase DltB (MBOAT superfamily)